MKGKVKKAVIVKFKGAHTHNHNSTEQLKTEIRQKLNASRDNRQKTAISNLHSYADLYTEESKDISRPSKIIDTSMNDSYAKKHIVKNSESKQTKEKIPSLKMKAQTKQIKNQKKAVNFGKNPMNLQKSERNLDKSKKDTEMNLSSVKKKQLLDKDNKRKLNKSMMNFNNKLLKNTSDNEEESIEKLNNENKNKKNEQKPVYKLDFKEMNYQTEIVKKSTAKKEKAKEPSLKIKQNEEKIITKPQILIEPEEIVKPELNNNVENKQEEEIIQENKPNAEDDINQLEIIEVKSNIVQFKKEEIKNEDNSNNNNNDDNNNDNNLNSINNNIDSNNNNINDNNKMINVENHEDNKDNINNLENNNENLDINENAPLKKNTINNKDINIPKNLKVPDSNKKPDYNNSPEKTIKKEQNKNNFDETLFAVTTEYDKQTEIFANGQIISESLWTALKVFYNNNKTDEMPSIKTNGEGVQYLTIDLFENFPLSKLPLWNL